MAGLAVLQILVFVPQGIQGFCSQVGSLSSALRFLRFLLRVQGQVHVRPLRALAQVTMGPSCRRTSLCFLARVSSWVLAEAGGLGQCLGLVLSGASLAFSFSLWLFTEEGFSLESEH